MNKLNTKKMVLTSALAVVMIGSAAAGFAFSSNTTANALVTSDSATVEGWSGMIGGEAPIDHAYEDGVTVSHGSIQAGALTNILDLPGSTIAYNLFFRDMNAWSSFIFTNGIQNINGTPWTQGGKDTTAFPWHSLGISDQNYKHGILHDDHILKADGKTACGTFGGLNGMDGAAWDETMVPVVIHIGKGDGASDPSYIKIGGIMVTHEQEAQKSVCLPSMRSDTWGKESTELKADLFPSGAYMGICYNAGNSGKTFITAGGSIYAASTSIKYTDLTKIGQFAKDLEVQLAATDDSIWEGATLTVKVNGHVLESGKYTVSTDHKVTITAATLNELDESTLDTDSIFTFNLKKGDTDYGSGAVALNIAFEEPPVLTTPKAIVLDKADAFAVTFKYDGAVKVTEEGTVKIMSGSTPKMTKKQVDSSMYTITKVDGKTDEYSINFTKEFADSIFGSLYTQVFTISFGKHELNTSVYLNVSTNEYGVRLREGIDYVDGTLVQDKYYTSATIKKFNEANLSSRIFYEKPVDVTKPFTVEYSTLDTSVEWVGLGIMNTPAISDYFSNEVDGASGNVLFSIFFGQGRHNMQALQGWTGDLSFEQNTNMRNNLVEIYFGADAEHVGEGYMKVNGTQINASFEVSQADFPEKKAWVGFFANNQKTNHDLTVNSSLNAVAVTSPLADSAYQMDLGAAKDFTVELMNTSGSLELSDEYDKIDAANYTFTKGATEGTGTLTIKAAYFSTRIFAQQGKVLIWDTEKETGTGFKMNYSHSGMAVGKVSFLTKGQLKDVEFDLGLSKVDYVLQDDKPVDVSKYTVEGGKFTVKAAAIANEVGYQKFIVASAGKLYPCYIYVNTWKDGIATTGASITAKDGTYTVTGEGGFTEAKAYKLSDGISVNFSFTTIGQYFHTGANKDASRVVIKLFDPYTGYTIVITIYANYEDEMLSSSNRALRLQQSILNGDGSQVAGATATSGTGRDVNAPSASGTISVILQENDKGDLVYTIGDREYSITKTGLAGINLDACVLTVSTEGSKATTVTELSAQAGTVAAHTHTFADTWTSDANNHWHAATCDHTEEKKDVAAHTFDDNGKCTVCGYEKEGNKEENKGGGGCGGVAFGLVGGGIALGALAVALVLVTRRKKED